MAQSTPANSCCSRASFRCAYMHHIEKYVFQQDQQETVAPGFGLLLPCRQRYTIHKSQSVCLFVCLWFRVLYLLLYRIVGMSIYIVDVRYIYRRHIYIYSKYIRYKAYNNYNDKIISKAVPIREPPIPAEIRIFRYGACKHIWKKPLNSTSWWVYFDFEPYISRNFFNILPTQDSLAK